MGIGPYLPVHDLGEHGQSLGIFIAGDRLEGGYAIQAGTVVSRGVGFLGGV
jgi:hypothetical protein